jgi:hypothetical protein
LRRPAALRAGPATAAAASRDGDLTGLGKGVVELLALLVSRFTRFARFARFARFVLARWTRSIEERRFRV